MENIFKPGSQNQHLEEQLETLPEIVGQALLQWRKSTLDRERLEASLYLKFKVEYPNSTATEIRAMVNANDERYSAVLTEASFESQYTIKLETLMAAKKLSSLRTAF